jgi:hypothetical protein
MHIQCIILMRILLTNCVCIGGVICWNGLELDSLEEKWILTTLANQLSFAQDTGN